MSNILRLLHQMCATPTKKLIMSVVVVVVVVVVVHENPTVLSMQINYEHLHLTYFMQSYNM